MRRSLPPTLALAVCGAAFLGPIVTRAQTAPAPGPVPTQTAPAKPGPDKSDKAASDPKASPEAKDAEARALVANKAMASYKAFFDAKLAGLHAGLELTPAQAALWAPVETAIRDLAKTNFAIHHPNEGEPTDTREGLERTSDGLIRAGQAMKALAEATGPLLAALDPDQKERLGKLLKGLPPHGILRKAFNVADDRAQNDREDDRHDEDRGDGGRFEGEHGRMEHRRHHEDHGYDRHRDDEREGDRLDDDDGDRGMREHRFEHGHDRERGRDDRDFERRHDDDESSDHRGSERHHGDMDDERT